MRLPNPPPIYDERNEAETRRAIELADLANLKSGQNVEMQAGTKLILQSPNGTRYYLTASNVGVLTLTAA